MNDPRTPENTGPTPNAGPTANAGPTPDSPEHADRRSLASRIPQRLFGGRVRTGTAALLVLFVGLLLLYGQRSDYYTRLDEANAAASATRSAAPRTTEQTPEYTEPATTRSSVRSSSSSASTSVSTSGEQQTGSTDGTPSTTTTTPPGLQLPTIPGIVLPGQTPTTTPAR